MATIKKAFAPIISVLTAAMQADENATIASVFEEVEGLAAAKTGAGGGKASTFHRNDDGEVVAVKCYYLNKWLHLGAPDVEFGEKKSSASGLNSMCKHGMSNWTKQNNAAKKEKEQLLGRVAEGEIDAADVPAELKAIDERKDAIVPLEGEYQGFETLEECLADAEEHGYTI
ncbi:hypothetical protein MS_047 [Vibrio phage VPMS1]|uniref:hypothetical protein n=1 Tax=Vibrio phage VPMS1 TaxID=1233488 RepID=UPI0003586C41|nr:hypothetical protein MS_047 [Vibrio phage VPMS1]AFV51126.1 hypothetical protein MS_047 [Vibrio phage VPMS1]